MESIKGESIRFVVTPLDIGPLMREAVFEPIKTAVFTSATLTVAGNFDYWAGRIGLDNPGEKEPLYQTFPSPFNYRENVLLGVPTDAPPPDSPKYKRFLSDFITRALTFQQGRRARPFHLLRSASGNVRRSPARARGPRNTDPAPGG